MGTTTFYLRHNDLKKSVSSMSKAEREKFDKLSPYGKEQRLGGWHVPCELHNGNVYPLVFWKGRLMKLEDTPMLLNKKYYDTYRGKTRSEAPHPKGFPFGKIRLRRSGASHKETAHQ